MKIAIKLPDDLRERILAFPFLHGLESIMDDLVSDEDEVSQLHLISPKEDIDVLNLLPFSAFYHEIEGADLNSIFSIHRACKNFKIADVDLFMNLSTTLKDATIGKNIGAKKSMGFNEGNGKFLYQQKIQRNQILHYSEQFQDFLKRLRLDVRDMRPVSSRSLPPLYADWSENKYTVINLDTKNGEINEEWVDFLDLFVNKNFVLMCSGIEKDLQKYHVESFIKRLPAKNTYKFFDYTSNIELGKLLSYAVGFITTDSPLFLISTYCGCYTFLLNEKEDLKNKGSQYLRGELRNFDISNPQFSEGNSFNYSKIFDELYDYIEEQTKVELSD